VGGIVEPQELDAYFHNLDMEDKYTKRLTVWEIAQAFPDCRDVAARIVYELSSVCRLTGDVMKDEWIKFDKRYKVYDSARRYLNMSKTDNQAKLDIDSAKSIKIQDIHDFGKVRKTGKRIQACCPLHEDKNPSFVIYTDNNTWHCFSCNRGGSVIDFIMYREGKKFIRAVKYLNGE
jgi:hypothetical protein